VRIHIDGERDVAEKLMQKDLKRLIVEGRSMRVGVIGFGGDNPGEKGLQGLSFNMPKKVMQEKEREESERPLKTKRKTEAGADVESDEDIAHFAGIDTDASGYKRAVSKDREEEEPAKKQKIKDGLMEVEVKIKPKKESNNEDSKESLKGRN
jgi:hypothetical protein